MLNSPATAGLQLPAWKCNDLSVPLVPTALPPATAAESVSLQITEPISATAAHTAGKNPKPGPSTRFLSVRWDNWQDHR